MVKSMTQSLHVRYVGDDAASVAEACDELDRRVDVSTVQSAGGATDADFATVDVVVCEQRANWKSLVERVGLPPLLVVADNAAVDRASALEAGAEGVIETTDGWQRVLAHRLEQVADAAVARDRLSWIREQVRNLREYTADAEESKNRTDLHDRTVDAGRDLFGADASSLFEAGDDGFGVESSVADSLQLEATELPSTDGLAGATLRDGETQLVADVTADDEATPATDAYTAALSLPVDDDHVFQILDRDHGAFSALDREFGELLVAVSKQVRHRIDQEEDLRSERDWFAALFANMPSAAIEYQLEDGVPVVENVNSNFIRIFGFSPETAIDTPVDELIVPEEDADDPPPEVERTSVSGEQLTDEVQRQTTDGRRSFLLHRIPVAGDSDDEEGYLIYTDITERKQRERELRQTNERLEEFASVVSHDLRNPISVARGHLQLAREDNEESLEKIDDMFDRMETIIEDLLALARHGQNVGETEPTVLSAVVNDAWETVDTAEAALVVAEDVEFEADHGQLLQLFENLVRNAIEHAGEDVTVTVGALDDRDGFFIADDGPGIPADKRDAVLESGYSTGEDGVGLGLSLVKRIVQAHDWEIEVTESADGGAQFEFSGVSTI
jgi:PAS domain S-box-containing protein